MLNKNYVNKVVEEMPNLFKRVNGFWILWNQSAINSALHGGMCLPIKQFPKGYYVVIPYHPGFIYYIYLNY